MKILVVFNVIEQLERGTPDDLVSEQQMVLTEQFIEKALHERGHTTVPIPIRDDLWEPLSKYDPGEWTIFNLCESFRNQPALEPYVVSVYENLGFRYTGSGQRTLETCLNKARTKDILRAHNIPTAAFQVFTPDKIDRQLDFPLFVKPVSEDASLGITLNSVVQDDAALRRQVEYLWKLYKEPALAEEFIDGREFNVTILGNGTPYVMPLSEINFRHIANPFARIVSFRAKWVPTSEEYLKTPPTCPAKVSPTLKAKIEDVAIRAYNTMGLRDYGRVDLRVRRGQPYVLEVNPNADLSHDAGIARASGVAGLSYADLADEVVRLAARRYRIKGSRVPRLEKYKRAVGKDGTCSIPPGALAQRKRV